MLWSGGKPYVFSAGCHCSDLVCYKEPYKGYGSPNGPCTGTDDKVASLSSDGDMTEPPGALGVLADRARQ